MHGRCADYSFLVVDVSGRFGEVLSRSPHNRMAPAYPPGKILSPRPALYRVVHPLNDLVEAVDLKGALEPSILPK
jgi:hypothetical protein